MSMSVKSTPCSCPTQVPIPVGVFRLCDDGVYEHGVAECGPCPDLSALSSEGVGTGADEGAPGQDTGSAWVTRSADCPEDPAQAHLLAHAEPLCLPMPVGAR